MFLYQMVCFHIIIGMQTGISSSSYISCVYGFITVTEAVPVYFMFED